MSNAVEYSGEDLGAGPIFLFVFMPKSCLAFWPGRPPPEDE